MAAIQCAGRTIILATGVTWRRLTIDGFDRLIGKGIYYGAARSEASATHGLDVHVIGAGNSAGQAALYFANHARTVTLVVRGDSLEASMSRYLIEQLETKSNVKVLSRSEVVAAHGDTHLTAVDIRNGGNGGNARAEKLQGTSAAGYSSSLAPTRKPGGCRRTSPATSAVMC